MKITGQKNQPLQILGLLSGNKGNVLQQHYASERVKQNEKKKRRKKKKKERKKREKKEKKEEKKAKKGGGGISPNRRSSLAY